MSHHIEGTDAVRYCLILHPRVYTNGRKDIRVGRSQDDGHCCSCRDTSDIDLVAINRPMRHILPDRLYNVGNPGWFPPITKLMCRFKPVPTEGSVSSVCLLRIHDYESVLLCQLIHTRPSSE